MGAIIYAHPKLSYNIIVQEAEAVWAISMSMIQIQSKQPFMNQ